MTRENITSITGYITTADGQRSEFSISADNGWQQWGAGRERLGVTVDVVQAIADAAAEYFSVDA